MAFARLPEFLNSTPVFDRASTYLQGTQTMHHTPTHALAASSQHHDEQSRCLRRNELGVLRVALHGALVVAQAVLELAQLRVHHTLFQQQHTVTSGTKER